MSENNNEAPMQDLVTVFIMGKEHEVPAEATIMGAIEYAGYQIVRGAGCREGYCGACGTVYRMPGDHKIYTGLACTTLVKPGMWLSQMPSIPSRRATYDLDTLTPNSNIFLQLYPEVFGCVACNTCTKACVQGLEVMDYIQAAKRGDIEAVMDLSFDCVYCGLCGIRCPAEITQMNVGLLAKLLYGKYLSKESRELTKRVEEVRAHAFDEEYALLMGMTTRELSDRYFARDIE